MESELAEEVCIAKKSADSLAQRRHSDRQAALRGKLRRAQENPREHQADLSYGV
jgi:hypothetical protein